MRSQTRTVSRLAAFAVAGAALAGGTLGQLILFAGDATVENGDVYDQIFIGDTAQVFMNGGEVLNEAIAASGGQIFIRGGEIGTSVRAISASFSTIPSEIFITGGQLGTQLSGDGEVAIGGLGEITIRAEAFFYDHDRDGVSDQPIDLGDGGRLTITLESEIFDETATTAIDGLRFVSADGAEETVDVFLDDAFLEWTGFLRLESLGASPADLNSDGVVDAADLATLIAGWGPCPATSSCPTDFNNDNVTDAADLAALIAAWGG